MVALRRFEAEIQGHCSRNLHEAAERVQGQGPSLSHPVRVGRGDVCECPLTATLQARICPPAWLAPSHGPLGPVGPGNGPVSHPLGLGAHGCREYRSDVRQRWPLGGLKQGRGTGSLGHLKAQKALLSDPSLAKILPALLLALKFLFLHLACLCVSDATASFVEQRPRWVLVPRGQAETLRCILRNSQYPWMSWYQQDLQGQLQMLASLRSPGDKEVISLPGADYQATRVNNTELRLHVANVTQGRTLLCTCSKDTPLLREPASSAPRPSFSPFTECRLSLPRCPSENILPSSAGLRSCPATRDLGEDLISPKRSFFSHPRLKLIFFQSKIRREGLTCKDRGSNLSKAIHGVRAEQGGSDPGDWSSRRPDPETPAEMGDGTSELLRPRHCGPSEQVTGVLAGSERMRRHFKGGSFVVQSGCQQLLSACGVRSFVHQGAPSAHRQDGNHSSWSSLSPSQVRRRTPTRLQRASTGRGGALGVCGSLCSLISLGRVLLFESIMAGWSLVRGHQEAVMYRGDGRAARPWATGS
ncbi:T-cell receptor beta chain V region E1 [Camelus dromedarius]|nr:T-cell receptor beta chain V region E1 [Camelus dromedarius]